MINKTFLDHLKDGQTIAISGIDSSYYPKGLINIISESKIKNLTLIYIENNAEFDPEGDPMKLILNGQVKKLITSHLGYMAKTYKDYLEDIELLPMDILAFKMQASANKLPGIVVDREYAELYRNAEWIESHSFESSSENGIFVFEPSFDIDVGVILADEYDPKSKNCHWNGTAYNCQDVARAAKLSIVEYMNEYSSTPDTADLPGQYVDIAIKSNSNIYKKTNWEE